MLEKLKVNGIKGFGLVLAGISAIGFLTSLAEATERTQLDSRII
jgi:hypothetical protein